MQQESVGKILQIKYEKKGIKIIFENFKELLLSENTFSNHYLYINKEITYKDYQDIVHEEQKNKELQKCISLLIKRQYSEFEITKKLKLKKITDEDINYFISYLKENDLINDEKYANDLFFYYNSKNIGKNKILYNLNKIGIDKKIILELNFDEDEELKKANSIILNLQNKFLDKSNLKRKQLVYNYLANNGFEKQIIDQSMKNIVYLPENEEKETLKREIIRLKVYNYDKEKIIHKLLLKGYEYKLIKEVWEEI